MRNRGTQIMQSVILILEGDQPESPLWFHLTNLDVCYFQHIDHIMRNHGTQIMQAVILILEGDHPVEVKEQALCILANVADGDSAKDYIMGNEDMLKKLMSYMVCRQASTLQCKNSFKKKNWSVQVLC